MTVRSLYVKPQAPNVRLLKIGLQNVHTILCRDCTNNKESSTPAPVHLWAGRLTCLP